MKKLLGLVLTLALLCMYTAAAIGEAAPATRIFVDSAGRSVEIPEEIDRIAPSGKIAHIVLYPLAGDEFVCVANPWTRDAETFFPREILELPVVGQFYGESALNMEALAAADPQIIIDIGEAKKGISEDMDGLQAQLGIPTVFIEANTANMGECYRMLGELLNRRAEAEALAAYCEEIYGKTVGTIAQIGEANKKKILYCLGENGQSVIGKGSYHAEIIDLIADNLAVIENPSSKAFGDPVDMEQLLKWEPDVIFFAPEVDVAAIAADPVWNEMAAIKSGNYYRVPSGPFNWMGFPPSVNRYIGMVWMGNVLYPEAFGYDMLAEAQRYYKLFYGYDLAEEELAEMMGN